MTAGLEADAAVPVFAVEAAGVALPVVAGVADAAKVLTVDGADAAEWNGTWAGPRCGDRQVRFRATPVHSDGSLNEVLADGPAWMDDS